MVRLIPQKLTLCCGFASGSQNFRDVFPKLNIFLRGLKYVLDFLCNLLFKVILVPNFINVIIHIPVCPLHKRKGRVASDWPLPLSLYWYDLWETASTGLILNPRSVKQYYTVIRVTSWTKNEASFLRSTVE